MAKLNIPVKQEGDQFRADEATQIVQAVNEVDDETKKINYALSAEDFIADGTVIVEGQVVPVIKINPDKLDNGADPTREELLEILQIIPDNNLQPKYFAGVTGSGETESDPFVFSVTLAQLTNLLKTVTNYNDTVNQMLCHAPSGSLVWAAIPTGGGSAGQLDAPVIETSGVGVNNFTATWGAVNDASVYVLELSDDNFATSTSVYTGPNLTFEITGLDASSAYKVRVKATAIGYEDSDWSNIEEITTQSDGQIPITTWLHVEDFTQNGNDLVGAELGGAVTRARSSAYIPAGQNGYVSFRGYGRIGLDDNPTDDSYSAQFNYGCYINSANKNLNPSVGGNYFAGGYVDVPNGVIPRIRVRLSANNVHFAYSIDNGVTWVENPANDRARSGGDLYIKADGGYEKTDSLLGIVAVGVVINGGLS